MSNSQSKSFAAGVLFGAAIGTVTGLLLAPRTGRETRKVIKKSAQAVPELTEDLTTSAQIQTERLAAASAKGWVNLQTRWSDAIAVGVQAAKQQRQALQVKDQED